MTLVYCIDSAAFDDNATDVTTLLESCGDAQISRVIAVGPGRFPTDNSAAPTSEVATRNVVVKRVSETRSEWDVVASKFVRIRAIVDTELSFSEKLLIWHLGELDSQDVKLWAEQIVRAYRVARADETHIALVCDSAAMTALQTRLEEIVFLHGGSCISSAMSSRRVIGLWVSQRANALLPGWAVKWISRMNW